MNRFFTLLIVLFNTIAYSQKLVETFNPKIRNQYWNNLTTANEIAMTSDGGILVGGYIDFFNGKNSGSLVKMDNNGQSYPGFNKITSDGAILVVTSLPDNKILICGDFTLINGVPAYQLARLNSDGSLDKTFENHLPVRDFTVQSNGKIVVYDYSYGIKRLLTNGTLDGSFHESAPSELLFDLRVMANNSIYLQSYSHVMSLNPDGQVDNLNFLETDGIIGVIQPLPNGQLMVGGDFTLINGNPINSLARVNATGTVDNTFKTNKPNSTIISIIQRTNGNFVVTGSFNQWGSTSGNVFELLPTGETLGLMANGWFNFGRYLLESTSGDIFLTGSFFEINNSSRVGWVRLNADNTVSSTFAPDFTYSLTSGTPIPAPAVTSKDDLIVCGLGRQDRFLGTFNNSSPVNSQLFQIDSVGFYDNTFASIGQYIGGWFTDIVIQQDDKLLLSGYLNVNSEKFPICRFRTNGTLDESFRVTTQHPGVIFDFSLMDSTIYAAGNFTEINGVPTNSIVSLDLGGNVIKTTSAIPIGSDIRKMIVQADKKIVAIYQTTSGNEDHKIFRLNTDGTMDQTFMQSEINGYVHDLGIDENGKIYILGEFFAVNGVAKKQLVRFNPDGVLDNTFSIGTGFSNGLSYYGGVYDIEILFNGKIVIGGDFFSYQGNICHGLVLIDNNGNFVSAGNFHLNRGSVVSRLSEANGYLYATGRIVLNDFHKVISIAKFDLSQSPDMPVSPPTNLAISLQSKNASLVWQSNSDNESGFIIERKEASNEFVAIDTVAFDQVFYLDSALIENHTYTYRITSFNVIGNSPPSNEVSIFVPIEPALLSVTIQGQDGVLLTHGTLFLYQESNSGGISLLEKIEPISDSHTNFSVDANKITLFFIPNKNIDSLYVPTIFGKTIILSGNNFIKVSNDTTIVFEILKIQATPAGSQVIEGNVNTGGGGNSGRKSTSKSARSSNEDIPVLLINDQGNVVAITQTDADGNYSFNGLVAGTYHVMVMFELGSPSLMDNPASIDVSFTSKDLSFDFTSTPPTIKTKTLQSITFDSILPVDYTYDFIDLVASSTSGLPVTYTSSNQAVATISNNTIVIVGAGTTMIKAKQTGDATYKVARDVDQILEVTKAPLTIRAENKTRKYSEANPILTFTTVGFKTGETESESGISIPSISTNASESSDAGSYTIHLEGGSGGSNYEFILQNAILTVEKADQTITFNPLQDIDTKHPPFELEASVTSGLPILFDITEGAELATLNGSELHLTGKEGVVTVLATQSGNINYNSAIEISRTFNINLVLGLEPQTTLISFFPNPTKGITKIRSTKLIKDIILHDIFGNELIKLENVGANESELNLSELQPSLYVGCVITNGDEKIFFKVIRAK